MTDRVEITIPDYFHPEFPRHTQTAMERYIKRAAPGYVAPPVHIRIRWYEGPEKRPLDVIGECRGALLRALKAQHVVRSYAPGNMCGAAPIQESFHIDTDNPRIEITITGGGDDSETTGRRAIRNRSRPLAAANP